MMRAWWVTIRLDPTRTQDIRLLASSRWAAWWLARQLHPGLEVLGVREVPRR
jgi:hypothetical protein